MSPTTVYVVRSGDWLAKIAEEHGTTWQAIWNHPDNAALRAQRGSPDVLYPGDVLHIPVASAPPPDHPVTPPALPEPPAPPAPEDPPWPYEPAPDVWKRMPTWECPEGLCECHAHRDDEPRHEHVIVLHDVDARRMPLARYRVYEAGRLISEEPAKANPLGELTVKLRRSTTTLALEWAPAELPDWPTLPYRKRYHVRLDPDVRRATDLRLANLGFIRGRRRQDKVKDYQRAYHQPQTGDFRDIQEEVRKRHDQGQLPPFPPGPSPHADPAAEPLPAELTAGPAKADPPPASASAPETSLQLAEGGALGVNEGGSPGGSQPGGGSGGQGSQGAARPDAGRLIVYVRHVDGRLLNPDKIALRLRPLRPDAGYTWREEALRKPEGPGIPIYQYVEFHFAGVATGAWAAIAHAEAPLSWRHYALGSKDLIVAPGSNHCLVEVSDDRVIRTLNDPLLDLPVTIMERRRKVLAMVAHYLPMAEPVAVGHPVPYKDQEYKPMYFGSSDTCTTVNNVIMQKATGSGARWGTALPSYQGRGWAKYQPGREPSVGDPPRAPSVGDSIYCTEHGSFIHCGVVIQSSGASDIYVPDTWLTADGGQPAKTSEYKYIAPGPPKMGAGWRRYYRSSTQVNGPMKRQAAYIVARSFDSVGAGLCNLWLYGQHRADHTYTLGGWRDVTHPGVDFPEPGFDANASAERYVELRKRALKIRREVEEDLKECERKRDWEGGAARDAHQTDEALA